MPLRLIKSIIILPGTVLVLIPSTILYLTTDSFSKIQVVSVNDPRFWIAIVLAISGLSLGIWTTVLFVRIGSGTPAPWDPPKRFVVKGPYRHVRNPMILGVLIMLLAESLVFKSWYIVFWTALFFAGNTAYFKYSEEPGLEGRFGDDYFEYKKQVRRWIPRIRPYS